MEKKLLAMRREILFFRTLLVIAMMYFLTANGSTQASDLVVRSLTVTDSKGQVVVRIQSHEFGGGGDLIIYDSKGRRLASLGVAASGGLAVEEDGQPMAFIGLSDTGGGIFLRNRANKNVVEMGASSAGTGRVEVSSKSGNTIWKTPAGK